MKSKYLPILLISLIVLISGCSESSPAPVAEASKSRSVPPSPPLPPANDYKDFVYISFDGAQPTTRLNAWLHENPNKSVVSFTDVVSRTPGNYVIRMVGCVIRCSEGSNAHQRFELVNMNGSENSRATVYGMSVLADWLESHPRYVLKGFVTTPAPNGNPTGYLICREEKVE